MTTVFQLSEHILPPAPAAAYAAALRTAEVAEDGGSLLADHVDEYLRPLGLRLARGWTDETHVVVPTPRGWELIAHVTTGNPGPVVSRVGDSLWTLEAGGTLIETGTTDPDPVDPTVALPVSFMTGPVLALVTEYLAVPDAADIARQRADIDARRAQLGAMLAALDHDEARLRALAVSGGAEYIDALGLIGAGVVAQALGEGWALRSAEDGQTYLAPTS